MLPSECQDTGSHPFRILPGPLVVEGQPEPIRAKFNELLESGDHRLLLCLGHAGIHRRINPKTPVAGVADDLA